MAFPQLKTGAVTQYPAIQAFRFQNQTIRFLDGTEQRYRDSAGALRAWIIQVSQLDEDEMAAFEQFFEANQGRFGAFAFTDPWDDTLHANCSFASDSLELSSVAEMRGRATLSVIENRG